MKISGLEKGILALTAAFLLVSGGYFLGQRSGGEPYTVSTQTVWSEELGAGMAGTKEVGTEGATDEQPLVNINTAGLDELQTLPGIGEVRAQNIVDDRTANGPFRIPEDITRVSGIGQGTLEDILDYITVE